MCVGVILPLCRRYGKSFLSSKCKANESSQRKKKGQRQKNIHEPIYATNVAKPRMHRNSAALL